VGGKVSPWVRHRENAGHVAGQVETDWGVGVSFEWSFWSDFLHRSTGFSRVESYVSDYIHPARTVYIYQTRWLDP
jgi:hypothetical protein